MRSGAPATRHQPGAKTGSLPKLKPRFREADMLRNRENTANDHPETRAPVLAGGRRRLWRPATSQPESGDTWIGARAEADAGGGPCGMRIRRVEEPSLAHAGSLVVWRQGTGPARTCPPILSRQRFRAGTIAFPPHSRHRDRRDRASVSEARGGIGRQDGTDDPHHESDLSPRPYLAGLSPFPPLH
jgi:hypothetical protein